MRKSALSAIVVVGFLTCAAVGEESVYFADANLKAAVEQALGVSNPTPSDMLRLTTLTVPLQGVTSLSGLEHATNLTSLYVWENEISDISPLADLTSLEALDLSTNKVGNLWGLCGLVRLKLLYLGGNPITELTPLSGLTSLTELGLYDTGTRDLSFLTGLTSLTRLYLGHNEISNISP